MVRDVSNRKIQIRPEAITKVCKAKCCSRDQLSREMGVATSTAYSVDAGRNAPSIKFIAALMHVSGSPFEELFEIVEAAE